MPKLATPRAKPSHDAGAVPALFHHDQYGPDSTRWFDLARWLFRVAFVTTAGIFVLPRSFQAASQGDVLIQCIVGTEGIGARGRHGAPRRRRGLPMRGSKTWIARNRRNVVVKLRPLRHHVRYDGSSLHSELRSLSSSPFSIDTSSTFFSPPQNGSRGSAPSSPSPH